MALRERNSSGVSADIMNSAWAFEFGGDYIAAVREVRNVPPGGLGETLMAENDSRLSWRPRRDLNPCYRRERAYSYVLVGFASIGRYSQQPLSGASLQPFLSRFYLHRLAPDLMFHRPVAVPRNQIISLLLSEAMSGGAS